MTFCIADPIKEHNQQQQQQQQKETFVFVVVELISKFIIACRKIVWP